MSSPDGSGANARTGAAGGASAPADIGAYLDEEHLRLACEAGRLGTWEWTLATDAVTWSPGLEAMHGRAPGSFDGTFAGVQEDMHPEDRDRVLATIAGTLERGGDYQVEYRIVRPDGAVRWVEGRGKLYHDAAGAPVRMIGVCMDISERKRAEAALRESEQRFARFMEQFPGLAWIKDAEGRYVYANDGAQRAFRTPEAQLYGRGDDEIFPPDTAAQFRDNDRRALASDLGIQVVETMEHEDGVIHHSLVSKFPIYGADGRARLIGGMAVDITDRRHTEERQKLLLAELNHRVKNTLAIVQSIAALTLRETPEPTAFNAAFSARVAALSRAHSLLTRELWQGAALADIVRTALAPFGGDARPEAIDVDGPPVMVKPNAAVTLSLVLHELATNAAKHGALATPEGRLDVSWTLVASEAGGGQDVDLVWRERSDRPARAPKKQGFGSRLIAASADQLGGTVELGYRPDGIEARLRFKLTEPAPATT
jgi:PAS domain S-box-containing protein